MTANDIITKCDRIKPNGYSYLQKRSWLKKAESDIIEYVNMYSGTKTPCMFDSSDNPDLYLDDTHENIYLYYLISMIDLSNQEYDLYNNSSAFFNHEFLLWKRKFRQSTLPECKISVKV